MALTLRGRRLLSIPLAVMGLVALGDWLFLVHPVGSHRPGWTIGLWLVALVLVVLARGRSAPTCSLASTWPAVAAALAVAATAVLEPRLMAIGLALLAIWTLAVAQRQGAAANAAAWLHRIAMFPWRLITQPATDLVVARNWTVRHGRRPGPVERQLSAWTVPAGLSGVFVSIFALANPVMARSLGDAFSSLWAWWSRILTDIPYARVGVWAVLAALAWCMLRARVRLRAPTRTSIAAAIPRPVRNWWSPALTFRCLLLFNVVFLIQSTMDVRYLLGGATLPDGMSFATYAHRGAYPLVAAALLAGGFTLIAFRADADHARMGGPRLLLVPWIMQCVFLLFTAAWRLWLYVDAYALTRWRVAAAVWMALVAGGLVILTWRIVARRDNDWLLRRTLALGLGTLGLCCIPDWEGIVANHNVRHCAEVGADAVPIDLEYLRTLGPPALPALAHLSATATDAATVVAATALAGDLRSVLDEELADWRGWTLRRWRLAQGPGGTRGSAHD
ncbi:MAG: DUF4173 domain-containing protein [Phycisphaerales bacterium]|nr:DUF4173 domain-containing protein [Phycisphaerales bacterium]